eukprot:Hpha_TRINITY_DN1785_c0_g1::TRINITY_DN1785_c0_g1_i1::g.158585::m.158585
MPAGLPARGLSPPGGVSERPRGGAGSRASDEAGQRALMLVAAASAEDGRVLQAAVAASVARQCGELVAAVASATSRVTPGGRCSVARREVSTQTCAAADPRESFGLDPAKALEAKFRVAQAEWAAEKDALVEAIRRTAAAAECSQAGAAAAFQEMNARVAALEAEGRELRAANRLLAEEAADLRSRELVGAVRGQTRVPLPNVTVPSQPRTVDPPYVKTGVAGALAPPGVFAPVRPRHAGDTLVAAP